MSLTQNRNLLAAELKGHNLKVVFAESCTAGLVSATLAGCPGISEHHCGSLVTYRPDSKKAWLWVKAASIRKWSCESEQVAEEMALGALSRTKEADWAASIVGHFGPNAPDDKDGVIWIGLYRRSKQKRDVLRPMGVVCVELGEPGRVSRQKEATALVLATLAKAIKKQHRKRK
jgi:PncC family amidohydrolase